MFRIKTKFLLDAGKGEVQDVMKDSQSLQKVVEKYYQSSPQNYSLACWHDKYR